MLKFMRKQHSKLKWVLWIVIVVLAGGMLITFNPFTGGNFSSVSTASDVALVGKEPVTATEFQTAYTNYVRNANQKNITPEMRRAFGFDRQILDYLVSQKVIMAEARRLGLAVTDEEITQNIVSNPTFQAGGSFIGRDRYEALLQSNSYTSEQFEGMIRNELLTAKMLNFVTAGVAVTDKEAEQEYRNRNEKAVLNYFVIDPAKLESKIALSDQDLKDYYEKNKAKYNVQEKRKSRYVMVDTIQLKKDVDAKITDADLKAYYDLHASEYRLPERVTAQHILFKTNDKMTPEQVEAVRKKATDVLARAKKGEDFSKLAKDFSEDSTAKDGGNLGDFERGKMVPEFEQAAFSLGPGAISDVVKTQFGFHIIKVNAKQEGKIETFEEAKGQIRPRYGFEKAGETAKGTAEQIAQELLTNKDLNAVAAKHNATVKETAFLEQNDRIVEFGNSAPYLTKVFSMKKDEIGTALEVQNAWVVPQMVDSQPGHPASFEEAKTKVTADAKSEKARQMATDNANKVQEQIKAGKEEFTALARLAGADPKTSEKIARGGSIPEYGPTAERDNEIFTLPLGKVGTPGTYNGKTLVFVVKERDPIKEDEMKKALDGLRTELLGAKRERYFTAYIKEAQKRMEADKLISINETAMQQIADRA